MSDKYISGSLKITIPQGQTIPSGRPNTSDKGIGKLGKKIVSVRERTGMLNKELCESLAKELGIKRLSPVTLYTWIKGVSPKKFQAETIFSALERIDKKRGGKEGNTTWVNGEEIAKQLKEWKKTLNETQIGEACNESRQVVNEWATGRHRVLRRKWETVIENVESVIAKISSK